VTIEVDGERTTTWKSMGKSITVTFVDGVVVGKSQEGFE
jgi:hypothetical protein